MWSIRASSRSHSVVVVVVATIIGPVSDSFSLPIFVRCRLFFLLLTSRLSGWRSSYSTLYSTLLLPCWTCRPGADIHVSFSEWIKETTILLCICVHRCSPTRYRLHLYSHVEFCRPLIFSSLMRFGHRNPKWIMRFKVWAQPLASIILLHALCCDVFSLSARVSFNPAESKISWYFTFSYVHVPDSLWSRQHRLFARSLLKWSSSRVVTLFVVWFIVSARVHKSWCVLTWYVLVLFYDAFGPWDNNTDQDLLSSLFPLVFSLVLYIWLCRDFIYTIPVIHCCLIYTICRTTQRWSHTFLCVSKFLWWSVSFTDATFGQSTYILMTCIDFFAKTGKLTIDVWIRSLLTQSVFPDWIFVARPQTCVWIG